MDFSAKSKLGTAGTGQVQHDFPKPISRVQETSSMNAITCPSSMRTLCKLMIFLCRYVLIMENDVKDSLAKHGAIA